MICDFTELKVFLNINHLAVEKNKNLFHKIAMISRSSLVRYTLMDNIPKHNSMKYGISAI